MPTQVEPVKVLLGALALGFSISEAFQRALGMKLAVWGRQHGFSPQEMWMCVNFYEGRVYPAIRDALSGALETTREKIDDLIESAAAQKIPA